MISNMRCPKCGWARPSSVRRGRHLLCGNCRREWSPLPLYIVVDMWRTLIKWRLAGQSALEISNNLKLHIQRVHRALTHLRYVMRLDLLLDLPEDMGEEFLKQEKSGTQIDGKPIIGILCVGDRVWAQILSPEDKEKFRKYYPRPSTYRSIERAPFLEKYSGIVV